MRKQKIEAIERTNELLASDAKVAIIGSYHSINLSIEEYFLKDSLDKLKLKSFKLSSTQYKRYLITPSEFLATQQNYEAYKLQRSAEAYTIHREIFLLFINAKMVIAKDNDHLKNKNLYDKITTAKDSIRNRNH